MTDPRLYRNTPATLNIIREDFFFILWNLNDINIRNIFNKKSSENCLERLWTIKEPGHEKMCLMPYANNKGADQPAHPCSLISAFIVHCLDSIIHVSLVSISKFPSLMLASVAEQASLSLTWSETPEDTFSHDEVQMFCFQKYWSPLTTLHSL